MAKLDRKLSPLAIIGPGLLVAATGVGAGDLATASFAGLKLGTAILWAIVLGAVLKYALTEGLARWQLATGQTILEGAVTRLGWPLSVAFIVYMLPWSFFVGAALISACGVTAAAMIEPLGLFGPQTGKIVCGAVHSAIGVALVWSGGFKLVERVMAACIALMFASVIVTAVLVGPDIGDVTRGLLVPRIPDARDGGLTWTIGLLGGVGGTLTIICYGYWIREHGRSRPDEIGICRIDLAVGYFFTALFGIAMVIIASGMEAPPAGRGVGLIVALAGQLETTLGPAGRWVFLAGAWAAVFSSLLGVWQAVPYVFADFVGMHGRAHADRVEVNTRGPAYRWFLLALAVVPLLQVQRPFESVQKYYAVLGAAFIPLFAIVLLILGGRSSWIGKELRNGPLALFVLVVGVLIFIAAAIFDVMNRLL